MEIFCYKNFLKINLYRVKVDGSTVLSWKKTAANLSFIKCFAW